MNRALYWLYTGRGWSTASGLPIHRRPLALISGVAVLMILGLWKLLEICNFFGVN